MVSDSSLIDRLREILRDSDLETATAASVRRRLEEEFSLDLYGRRAFIREQIDLFLQGRDGHGAAAAAAEKEEEVDENAQQGEVEGGDGDSQEGEISEDEEEEEELSDGERSNKRNKSMKTTEVKTKGGRGFSKPCLLSPQLQEFLGVAQLARTEVVKKIWAHIREQNLQNPNDRRKILCDESLHGIFRVKSIDMFQMNKVLSKHIWPLDEVVAPPVNKSSQKDKQRRKGREVLDEPKRKEKPKKGGGGLTAPQHLSDALVNFLGTGEDELSRTDVVKRMWQYIKENELQDPSDKRMVLCDENLKELFGVDSFHGFTVSKLLVPHFTKAQD
ncbi:SWIB complex BAF60b domain-containing protein [Striga hermonthica]|uniref:SWIB complex BAF60b domain-containing protein n=1 Tax=Striga hermonthica TaxID=68872 RepID=A0A9N7QZT8_STRHE|nr:SWIB complex BAF60b domain-containing protein [Striga hermonthica]